MNPAPSIIAFTTSSGLGYGMLFILALGGLTGLLPPDRWLGLVGLFFAFGFITGGLLSSLLHLGHPKRAGMALSQWRSSWLAREGIAALMTYPPALVLGIGWVFFETTSWFFSLFAVAAALGAGLTVFCTGMIYASLPPIRAWHHWMTAPIYLGFALMTGALAVHFLVTLFAVQTVFFGFLALVATAVVFGLKIFCWQLLLKTKPSTTAETATGLGEFGLVRMLDPPHTQTNYLLQEMGFAVGRKHARRIRRLVFAFGLFGSLILTLIAMAFEGWLAPLMAFLALISGMIGTLLERWLFFAEAEHTSMLFYSGKMTKKKKLLKKPVVEKLPDQAVKPQRRSVSTSISGSPLRQRVGEDNT